MENCIRLLFQNVSPQTNHLKLLLCLSQLITQFAAYTAGRVVPPNYKFPFIVVSSKIKLLRYCNIFSRRDRSVGGLNLNFKCTLILTQLKLSANYRIFLYLRAGILLRWSLKVHLIAPTPTEYAFVAPICPLWCY
jgi:hypothetical protein